MNKLKTFKSGMAKLPAGLKAAIIVFQKSGEGLETHAAVFIGDGKG